MVNEEVFGKTERPVTHFIYCPRHHRHWPDLGGAHGALTLGGFTDSERREVIHKYMKEGKQVKTCVNGPYKCIQSIYKAFQEGRTP